MALTLAGMTLSRLEFNEDSLGGLRLTEGKTKATDFLAKWVMKLHLEQACGHLPINDLDRLKEILLLSSPGQPMP